MQISAENIPVIQKRSRCSSRLHKAAGCKLLGASKYRDLKRTEPNPATDTSWPLVAKGTKNFSPLGSFTCGGNLVYCFPRPPTATRVTPSPRQGAKPPFCSPVPPAVLLLDPHSCLISPIKSRFCPFCRDTSVWGGLRGSCRGLVLDEL